MHPTQPNALLAAAAAALLVGAAPAAGQQDGSQHQEHASSPASPRAAAVRRDAPIRLDGVLDEAVWAAATPATGFLQNDPDEGKPATQRTEVRFAYDDQALYVGARMFDSLGTAGVRTRLARRDQEVEGDYLLLTFDTFHDHVGRTELRVNPSGVKYDAGQGSSYADPSWNPVWEAATAVDSLGWTAELRIPLSQLRFPRDSAQLWGLQITRFVERLNERSSWAFWTRQDAGGPQRFGHLAGLELGRRPRGFELLPYAVGRASYVEPTQPGSPFQQAREYDWRFGADVKTLLGSSLTLSATVNPDFGQVEVDPAVVNLSAFETFFSEQRPFFVEGSGVLGFGSFSCFTCSNVSSMSLFYSRRIGRRPQGTVPFATEFTAVPENTAILGAAKITGRLPGGLEVGVLEAVTGSARASVIDQAGTALEREVEPLTNYFVGRARRSYRGGNVTVGAIGTSVLRRFDYDSLRHQIPAHAEALGLDWNVYWKERTYRLMGNFALSSVSGDSVAIARLQTSSARYYQRPDRAERANGLFTDGLDPSLGSLRGHGGYLRLAREAGEWRWETQVNYRSPGFEVNDLAFVTRTDYVWMLANVNRRWTTPTRWYRSVGVTTGAQRQYNFEGDATDGQVHVSAFSTLANYWGAGLYFQLRPEVADDRLTRGGPVVRRARQWFASGNVSTDGRKPLVLSAEHAYGRSAEGGEYQALYLGMRLKPASNLQLSFRPSFSRDRSTAQFVTAFEDPSADAFHGRRVVFAELSQKTLSLETRLNVTFTPTLTLEMFAQPFVSTGDYGRFREFVAPRTVEKREFGPGELAAVQNAAGRDSVYRLDADGDPATDAFSFNNPDFNLRSLRGNAVLRWEYRPGSTLFFVWQQQRRGADSFDGRFDLGRDAPAIFRERPDNVFVIKASYWLGR